MKSPLEVLQVLLNYQFSDQERLALALSRRAAIDEGITRAENYDVTFSRYKFFGARILGLLVADLLFSTSLFDSEEALTIGFERVLQREGLIVMRAATHLSLPNALILGRGEALQKIQYNDRVLLDHMQALYGAMWFDSGGDYQALKISLTTVLQLKHLDYQATGIILEVPQGLVCTSNLERCELKLTYKFNDYNLLISALIRQSAIEEAMVDAHASFQTMEFLGDKVFNCLIAEWLLEQTPQAKSADLTPQLSCLVSNLSLLPKAAKNCGVAAALILGAGEEKVGVRHNSRKLADHMEAVIAAMWLDSECDYVRIKVSLLRLFGQDLKLHRQKSKPSVQALSSEQSFPHLAGTQSHTLTPPAPRPAATLSYAQIAKSNNTRTHWRRNQSPRAPNAPNIDSQNQFPALSSVRK